MKIGQLVLMNCKTDDKNIDDTDILNDCELILSDYFSAWNLGEEYHIYNLSIYYGNDINGNFDKNINFDISMDQLELFAHSIIKSIDMLRRDYKEEINEAIKKGNTL